MKLFIMCISEQSTWKTLKSRGCVFHSVFGLKSFFKKTRKRFGVDMDSSNRDSLLKMQGKFLLGYSKK